MKKTTVKELRAIAKKVKVKKFTGPFKRVDTCTPELSAAIKDTAAFERYLEESFGFGSRYHMLETLHQAYRYILDEVSATANLSIGGSVAKRRLDNAAQRELGRNLAKYFDVKQTISP